METLCSVFFSTHEILPFPLLNTFFMWFKKNAHIINAVVTKIKRSRHVRDSFLCWEGGIRSPLTVSLILIEAVIYLDLSPPSLHAFGHPLQMFKYFAV